MKRNNHMKYLVIALTAILLTMSVSSCSKKKNEFNFKNIHEAVSACHQELSVIRDVRKADMEQITTMAARWIALQDTTYNIMMADTTIENNDVVIVDFYMVADSIRQEITRLATQSQRSMVDIIKFKIGTAREKDAVRDSKAYQVAKDFYAKLDDIPPYKTLDETIKEYRLLLDSIKPFKKEGEMLEYITKEDRCFRSLMIHLYHVNTDELEDIAQKTEEMFENLYRSTKADPHSIISKRVMTFLTMRLNRRIIQNAEAIISDTQKKYRLSTMQAATYRWMLIQPYLTIDNYSMAYVTPKQEEQLTRIAKEIPAALAYLDGKDLNKSPKDKVDHATNIIADYFLKMYINQAL